MKAGTRFDTRTSDSFLNWNLPSNMLPSKRPTDASESSDDTSFDEGVELIARRARQAQHDVQIPATAATADDQTRRPGKRARTTGPPEFKADPSLESGLLAEHQHRFLNSSLAAQLAQGACKSTQHFAFGHSSILNNIYLWKVSQGATVLPDFFRAQPSGMSFLPQEQVRAFPGASQSYLYQGQEQLLNPSLLSLFGSAQHQGLQQIPTIRAADPMTNPLLYSHSALLPGPEPPRFFLPTSQLRVPQPPAFLGSSFSQYFQTGSQIPSAAHFNPNIETLPQTPSQSHLEQSQLPFMATMYGGGQPFLQPPLQLTASAHQNPLSAAATASDVMSAEALASTLERHSRATLHTGDSFPLDLPVLLARPEDSQKLSLHQILLRHQIEAFRATNDDVVTHTRGRNKPITLGQVGIRCRHCAHLPVAKRQKGSAYFPATLLGLYQAAQNMSTTHIQCRLCSETPMVIKQQFAMLMSTKASSSGAGRPYWAESAKKLGLVDTEDEGIRFVRDVMPDVPPNEAKTADDDSVNEDESLKRGK